jgi:hypothetical protein
MTSATAASRLFLLAEFKLMVSSISARFEDEISDYSAKSSIDQRSDPLISLGVVVLRGPSLQPPM